MVDSDSLSFTTPMTYFKDANNESPYNLTDKILYEPISE